MILIADAHTGKANVGAFFEMLEAIADTGETVVFLGDIFDLWIGLPRYETDQHRRFLEWCRRERDRRTIGFVEGNHEFFVVRHHANAFTWSNEIEYVDPAGHLFVHGDLIDRRDLGYRLYRAVVKNALAHVYLRAGPAAPALVRWIKRSLEREVCSKPVPRIPMDRFAAHCSARGVRRVFCGHFHPDVDAREVLDRCVVIVPAWNTGGYIARLAPDGSVRVGPWPSLLDGPSGQSPCDQGA